MSEPLILIAIFIVATLYWVFRAKGREADFQSPETQIISAQGLKAFEAAPSLFVNASERAFYKVLKRHIPKGYDLQTKTRLEDIIRVKAAIKGKDRWAHRGRVKSRHVDFLIINHEGVPMIAIELDGASHNTKNPSPADKLKTGLFKQVQIPLCRVKVGDDFEYISTTICAQLSFR